MALNKTDSATVTDMTNTVANFTVTPAEETGDITYMMDWTKWLGFYMAVPDLQSSIDKKAIWTVGKGYKADKTTTNILKKIRGNGKETFNSILFNIVKTYTIGGDYFGEIVLNDSGKLINLKTMNPGSVEVRANKFGIINKYIQKVSKQKEDQVEFKPEKIFHIQWNKLGDNIHGLSTIAKLTSDNQDGVIEMHEEAMKDLRVVFHRYVKPLIISKIDEDDPDEIEKFKKKMDNAVNLGENIVVPKETVELERMSIPQFSTLDPLPWLTYLDRLLIKAEGVPAVILGDGQEATEATAKILYLAFQQMIEWNQLFLEEQIEAQLGLKIELEFPASLEDGVETPKDANSKARKLSNMEMKNGKPLN